MMSEEMKEMLKTWDVEPSKEHKAFECELNDLISKYNTIKLGLKEFVAKSENENILNDFLSLLIGEIHEETFRIFNFLNDIQIFFKKLKESRLSYLKKQFDFLEECEREQLIQDFTEDEKKWKELFQMTINILKNCKNPTSSFPGNCYPQVETFQKKLLKSHLAVFENIETKKTTFNEIENRSHLLALNDILTKYKEMIQDLYDNFVVFQNVVFELLEKMKNLISKMRLTIVQEQQLNVNLAEICPEIIQKREIIQELQKETINLDSDISFIIWEINKFQSISKEILKTLRYCIN